MIKFPELRIYADFETTVEQNTDEQTSTEVWSAAWIMGGVPNTLENVNVVGSIDKFMNMLDKLPWNSRVYFHNLSFDGSFILTWMLKNWKQDIEKYEENGIVKFRFRNLKPWELQKHHFQYSIAEKGQWYSITFKNKRNRIIRIWDSMKLIPGSIKKLGDDFKTEHRKKEMEYKGKRYADCPISTSEMEYIKNDVLVLKELMETMNAEGIDSMTIGGACLKEYKTGLPDGFENEYFPDLTVIKIPDYNEYKNRTADDFIRKSYHGGFCYVNPKYKGIMLGECSHYDANSHYPSQMHSKSGNYYPVGAPRYYRDKDVKNVFGKSKNENYYFIRFSCSFELCGPFLPSIQIKDNPLFVKERNEWLTSSHGYNVMLTMTRTDFERFIKTYKTENLKLYEALEFDVKIGLFDSYIDKWMGIKMTAKGSKRQISKLFLNNLYGKFSASRDSSYKIAYYVPDKGLRYVNVKAQDKTPGFIAIGSAVTSYCRNKTMELAEANIEYYVYSDTDSNVFCIPKDKVTGIPVDPVALCFWDCESVSDKAIFVRQKTYIEHIIESSGEPVKPNYNLRCAGMGKEAQKTVTRNLQTGNMKMTDFKVGFHIDGCLKKANIDGGVLLKDKEFKMR